MGKKPYRIIFMGTPTFALPTLEALLANGEEVVAAVTQPDRQKGRGRKLLPPPVKEFALANSLPVLQPVKIKAQKFHDQLQDLRPDLIVVTAYGRILPASLLFLPPLGSINVHASLLPKYRGAAPVQWALINGEEKSGVTIMQMDEGLDTGDILLAGEVPINPRDTAATLAINLAELGGRLIVKALELLRSGGLSPKKQEAEQAALAPPLTKEDGRINWHKSAFEISCLIRGMDPWPMAFTTINGKWLRLFSPTMLSADVAEMPGTISRADKKGLLIATGNGYLLVDEVQLEGGRRLAVSSFLNGHPLAPGTRFE